MDIILCVSISERYAYIVKHYNILLILIYIHITYIYFKYIGKSYNNVPI